MLKSKNIITLVLVVGLTVLISSMLSNLLITNQSTLRTKVEVADAVTSEFNYKDKPYFSADKLNPTKDITVSENNNTDPLGQ